jgi:NAD(P)-dependent dehydrogenase (short-subunit alcohol dehydrogenase family)
MNNPVVLITVALTGIGRATAIAFAKDGARTSPIGRYDGPPMTLGNMRANGVRTLDAWCLGRDCHHHKVLDVSTMPNDVTVPSIRPPAAVRALRPPRRRRTAELVRVPSAGHGAVNLEAIAESMTGPSETRC